MRKLTIGLVVMFVLLATALSAAAASATHKVTGGGWYLHPYDDVKTTQSFTAQIDEKGNVKGQMEVQGRLGIGTHHIDVTTLDVNGNEALIGGIITQAPESPWSVGEYVQVKVIDNDQGKDTEDQITDTFYGSVPSWVDLYPFKGNIQVT